MGKVSCAVVVGSKVLNSGEEFQTIPSTGCTYLGDGMSTEVIEIINSSAGTVLPNSLPAGIVNICRGPGVHRNNPVLSVIGVGMNPVAQQVAGGIVAVTHHAVVGVEAEAGLRPGTGGDCLIPPIPVAVITIAEGLSALARRLQAIEFVI